MRDHNSTTQGGKQLPGDRMLSVLGIYDLTHAERCLMAALAYHDGPGGCHPSIERLAGILHIHRITLYEHLKKIRDKGYLQWEHGQSANVYTLVYEPLTVRETQTLKENPTVRKSPPVTVRKSLTQREEGNKGRREERESVNREGSYKTSYVEGIGEIVDGG